MAADEELRAGGFRRILARLDAPTRHKHCGRALGEDLQRAQTQLRACDAALAQAAQVADASRRLEAEASAVAAELLDQLEALRRQLESATKKLGEGAPDVAQVAVKQEQQDADLEQAKALAKQLLQEQELDQAVHQLKQLSRLLPHLEEVDEKKGKWWTKHMHKAVSHVAEMLKGHERRAIGRLEKVLGKVETKCPELKSWSLDVKKQIAEKQEETTAEKPDKSKKKRAIPLPDNGMTAMAVTAAPSTSSKEKEKRADSAKEKGMTVEKTRSLLNRCYREVRTLRDKFELGAFDVNLSRMVTVVDSLWPGMEQSEIVSLTTALFTLVETAVKVGNHEKRLDRLMCLESVLGVVLGSPKLQLTARRKTIVEEYANNCRQSREQLTRQSEKAKQPIRVQAVAKPVPARAGSHSVNAKGANQAKSHVRFD